MKITLLYAHGSNQEFGYEGGLPWPKHKRDMEHFKRTTKNKHILAGRRTFDTLPELPNRHVHKLTSNYFEILDGINTFSSLDEALNKISARTDELIVIGGASVLEQCVPYANEAIVTTIFGSYKHDIKVPDLVTRGLYDYSIIESGPDYVIHRTKIRYIPDHDMAQIELF